jgi:hypothetical protein
MGISLYNRQQAEPFNGTTLTITGLTATRVPYISTGGLFVDAAGYTYGASTLTVPNLAVTGLTSGRIPIAGTAGLLGDDADLTFSGDTLTATKLAVSTSASIPAITSDVAIGSTTAGKNVTVNATETESITSPMVTGGWTLGYDTGGWTISGGVLSKTVSTGTQAATAVTGMTITPTAGTKYLVTAVVSAASGTTTWTLGGTTIPSFTAAATYSYVVTAGTTAKLIFSGVAASTCTITSVSVKEIATASGNATVENDATIGRVLAQNGSAAYPSISFAQYPTYGAYVTPGPGYGIALNGVTYYNLLTAGLDLAQDANARIRLGYSSDVVIIRDAANTLALRNSTAAQTFNWYGSYTDASNRYYGSLSTTASSINISALTAGTGPDDIDIIATPAGTGSLKSATNLVHSGTPDIVSSAGAISVATAITHVVTNGAGTVLTLAAGKEGQIKYIVLKTLTSGGQTDVVTPDGGGAGFTTITMDAVGDACTLLYTNAKWTIVGSYSCTIA